MTMPHIGTALVTGASGFIGKALCERLQSDGWNVVAMLRTKCAGPWDSTIIKDLSIDTLSSSELNGIEVVFHLAATADIRNQNDISRMDRLVNIEGTEKVLNASSLANIRKIVYFSSVKAMGEGGDSCLDENSVCQPTTSYGKSKLEAERLLLGQRKVPVCILRLPMVYGGIEHGNLVNMIYAIRNGRFPPISDVHNKRSMVHLSDVLAAAIMVSRDVRSDYKLYLLTDGSTYSTRQIYNWICANLGIPPPSWNIPMACLNLLAAAGDVFSRVAGKPFIMNSNTLQKLIGSAWYSNERICKEIGFKPQRNLRQSLPEIISGMGLRNIHSHVV